MAREASEAETVRKAAIRLSIIIFWVCLSGALAQSPPLDLRGALDTAQTANLELRAARQQRALAIAGITTARQFPNPTISFTAARDTPHEGVSLDLPVELGNKRGKRIAVAKEEQKSTEIDIAVLGRQIRRRTREAFYQSLSAAKQTEQAKTALDLTTRIRDMAHQRFEAGDVAQLEVLQVEVELARASADYETTAQAQRSAEVGLAALLNRGFEEHLVLQGELENVPKVGPLNSVIDQALQTNGDLLKTSQDLNIEERQLELAKAQRIPNLGLSAGADFNSPPDFHYGGKGGLSATVPIFYRDQGEIALSKARLELLRLTVASQRTNVSAQVAAAYYDYAAKVHQVEQYGKRVLPDTLRLEQMAEDSYQSGKSSLLTLLDTQRRLNEVRKTYLDALFSAQGAFAALEEVVGAPLD
jgi:cobalt-zinc-cadmium efflux system outer membrane protein